MQRLRRLSGRRSARAAEGMLVAEGSKVLGEALRAGAAIESVYLDPAAGAGERRLAARCHEAGARIFDLESGVLARVSDTVTPQPIVGVVAAPARRIADLPDRAGLVIVCAELRDPGNAGTVLRCADAVGADGVISCDASVDLFNPKTVRASAGAVFHLPVVNGGDSAAVLGALAARGLRLVGAAAHGGVDYLDADWSAATALVLGNEAHGLPADVGQRLDLEVTIPLAGRAESLNVGTAAAVLCFEALRQRRAHVAAAP